MSATFQPRRFPFVTYDREANAAYIYLRNVGYGEAAHTVVVDDSRTKSMINLDLDAAGRLIGIEVLDATLSLPQALLDSATCPGVEGTL
ncbi:MAG: DUF2283 domain-containing protein [Acidobacteria bacterium]|nr:DUF2283 domain-containing protein [Acidobacteriota bacterium]